MMIGGAVGFYLGIDTPPLPFTRIERPARRWQLGRQDRHAGTAQRDRHLPRGVLGVRIRRRDRAAPRSAFGVDMDDHGRMGGRRRHADRRRHDRPPAPLISARCRSAAGSRSGTSSAVCKALSKRCQRSPAFPKISTISFRKKKHSLSRQGEFPMRLGQAIFFGSAAALLTLAAPTLARNSSANSHTAKGIERLRPPAMPTSRRPTVRGRNCPVRRWAPRRPSARSAAEGDEARIGRCRSGSGRPAQPIANASA